ncbi:MAG: helix-turn-helix domain-containing protein [Candidatus Paceibacterota bacterium]
MDTRGINEERGYLGKDHVNQLIAEKLQLIPINDAYELMDNLVHDGENTDLSAILTFQEASNIYGLSDGAVLRKAQQRGRFLDGEVRQSGSTWLVTRAAMERLYGKK